MTPDRRSGSDRRSEPPGATVFDQESLKAIAALTAELPYIRSDIASVRSDVKAVRETVDGMPELIEKALKNYVRVEEFVPIRTIVFGMVGLILSSVLVAVLALVIIKVA